MIRTARGPVRWFLKATRFAGITLPPFGIYLLAERMGDMRLRRHEEAHWQQAKTLGVARWYWLYLWYSLRYGYWNNPLEVEAREAENDGLHRP